MHEQTGTDALVEEYIEGRELYVGVLGNDRLRTFPVWEMDFGTLPEVRAGIATRQVKWDRKYQKKHGIKTGAAQSLPDGCAAYLDRLSKRIYRTLSLSGYARLDFRLRPDGSIFVLEANANPNISHQEDFADSARGRRGRLSGAARADPSSGLQLPGGVAGGRGVGLTAHAFQSSGSAPGRPCVP